jgi:hypothetical protein
MPANFCHGFSLFSVSCRVLALHWGDYRYQLKGERQCLHTRRTAILDVEQENNFLVIFVIFVDAEAEAGERYLPANPTKRPCKKDGRGVSNRRQRQWR